MTDSVVVDLGRANPKQAKFYASTARYVAYGGARGGGKSHAVRVQAVRGALLYPGIRILIVRRTYPELENTLILPLLHLLPEGLATYNATNHRAEFINGSVIRFGHFSGLPGELEYQGQEYDWIFVDEATQFTEREFRVLGACLRGVSDIPKRFYLTCNPGGVGHGWVKRLFITRDYRDGERAEDYEFIPATVEDNSFLLEASPDYIRMLDALPEDIRRAHRYGDWDVLAGQFFPEFDPRRHVAAPQAPPPGAAIYRAIDYGLDMLACLWIAVGRDGRALVYREYCSPGLIVSRAASEILRRTPQSERIIATIAPPDLWSRQKDSGRGMDEIFAERGVPLVRASPARAQGWMMVKELLQGDPPKLTVTADCVSLRENLPQLLRSAEDPSDCATEPHEITHVCDALRYFAAYRAAASAPPARRDGFAAYMTGGEPGRGYV